MATVEAEAEKRVDVKPERSQLPFAVKSRIVQCFAHFQTVSQARATILKEFGLDLSYWTLATYDPDSATCRMGRRLQDYFGHARQAYIERTAEVAVAHQSHRLRLIGEIVEKAGKSKDYNAALKGLELAAREMGGQLTNVQRREVTGTMEHRHLSVEDARAELAMRLGALIDGGTLTALPPPTAEPQPAPIPPAVAVATVSAEAVPEAVPQGGEGLEFGGFRPDLAKG